MSDTPPILVVTDPPERFDCWDDCAIDSDPEGAYVFHDAYEEVEQLLLECYSRLSPQPAAAELVGRIKERLKLEPVK